MTKFLTILVVKLSSIPNYLIHILLVDFVLSQYLFCP